MSDPASDVGDGTSAPDPVAAARGLLERVRRQELPTDPLRTLADASHGSLESVREDRHHGLAFWLNVYNAAAQLLLEARPELFDSRWRFFRVPSITVAGAELSLDDIEHGVLRGRRSKYGLGYLPRLSTAGLPKAYRLEPDPRIHFALNCGAASCPAVLAYEPDTIDETLDRATKNYLDRTVTYDAERNRVQLPRVCLWFVGDFGGRSGLRSFLRAFEQIPPGASPSLRFRSYDWTRASRKFAT
ncbi:DUF547 domain-containing protein [Natronococcus sp. A-GB7]|uniref:DUF547 domain-containing protein n=1 Tax=Natronococcus sp. A-GB7 TaxID=3037649 RepID=UPI00241D4072|nr:DUF547 domain-containing protein [Natronococcus sp. A-GB7]MDG5818984.1 DUF547 domain-containing protein [Natronococcus sp. A-GB7]